MVVVVMGPVVREATGGSGGDGDDGACCKRGYRW